MSSKIKITFLGTGDSIPSAKRNHTAISLNYKGDNFLVDCGEGTQRQFRKAELNPCKITHILITHFHGDHILGLPGLIETLSLSGYNKTLKIYGPKGIKSFMKKLFDLFHFHKNYNIEVFEVYNEKFIDEEDYFIECFELNHGVKCNGYCFVQKGELRIDKNKLKKLKIKQSPILKNLKQGKDIVYQGKKYKYKELTFKEQDKKICFILDTKFDKKISFFVKNSDILVCEACFTNKDIDKAEERNHLTSEQAAKIADKSKSKKLILTHISQRYIKDFDKISKESKKVFKNSFIAKDFDSFEL